MGKKHHLSYLVADLTKTNTTARAAPPAGNAPSAAAKSSALAAAPRTSKFRKHDDFSSSSSDDENDAVNVNLSKGGPAKASLNYVAVPKQQQLSSSFSPTAAAAAAVGGASKRPLEKANADKNKTKVAVVETLTIGGKKIVASSPSAESSSDSDDDDDDISIDSFDAEEMNSGSKALSKKHGNANNTNKSKMTPPTKVGEDQQAKNKASESLSASDDGEEEDEEDDGKEHQEEAESAAGSWDDEDLEALMAMGGESDEEEEGENEEELLADEESEGDFSDEEDDDEDDDDYKNVASELVKAKKNAAKSMSNNEKNPNPNKKDESVVVNFDAFGFEEKDIDQTIHLLDNFVPDRMNEVDRDEFSAVLIAEPTTMIIKQGERESDDDEDEDEDDSDHDDGIASDDEGASAPPLNDDVEDVFAVYSLVPITQTTAAAAQKQREDSSDEAAAKVTSQTASVVKALGNVLSNPWAVMQKAPTSVAGLLLSASTDLIAAKSTEKKNNKKKADDTAAAAKAACPPAVLLVMDHIKTVPIDVTIAALDNIIADAEGENNADEARYDPKQLANMKIVCFAKIQRNAEKDNAKNKGGGRGAGAEGKVAGAPGENNNKRRNALISSSKIDKSDLAAESSDAKESLFTEQMGFEEAAATYADADRKAKEEKRQLKVAVAAENNGFQLSDYVFWRPFEESLYDRRDTTVSVHAIKCRAQYDEQPDNDRPITVAFAVTWNGLKSAVAAVRNLAIPTAPAAPGFF